jgi:CRP-like cAMP-binding protein
VIFSQGDPADAIFYASSGEFVGEIDR